MTDWIFFGISAAFALIGMCAFAAAALGVFRFDHALYRMHATAVADTIGIACFTISACVRLGADLVTLKELAAVGLMLLTSPVSTHLLAEIEYAAGDIRRAAKARGDRGSDESDGENADNGEKSGGDGDDA